MEANINLSVIILGYRAGDSIKEFAQKTKEIVRKLTSSFEIILVGNYIENSEDKTKDIIEKFVDDNPDFISICKPKKGMMGWDMKEGLNISTGKYICVIDGDGQFPIESIEKCYKEIIRGEYDLVKTYRSRRNDGFYRKLISKVYNFIFSVLFSGIKSKDVNSKPKMFTREAYEIMNLKSDDWFIDAEIMLKINENKMKFYEFPVEFYELSGRASFVKFKAIFEFVKNLISYKLKKTN
ncbi:MAG: hypothetical protein DRI94_02670 [Bacteroidetes bacterium]|nr:MAG: hypothetical protein DRI94_02670 [Bacteroidota bacterium]